jgi:hypothetical protein
VSSSARSRDPKLFEGAGSGPAGAASESPETLDRIRQSRDEEWEEEEERTGGEEARRGEEGEGSIARETLGRIII